MKSDTSQTIQVEGAELRINEYDGHESALIFLHYWGGSKRTWRPLIEKLERGTRCVTIDQRGWGESRVSDGRFDLEVMAADVEAVVSNLGIQRYVLVGHSMGGKVAQIVAKRQPSGLVGLILVAPAPPTPMPVPKAQRAAMLSQYQSREGAQQALSILAGSTLPPDVRNQVIEDPLRGASDAKRAWTDHGMIQDISANLDQVTVPVNVIVGSNDQVESELALRESFNRFLPQATFQILDGVGHLLPLEAPAKLAATCNDMISHISSGEVEAVCR